MSTLTLEGAMPGANVETGTADETGDTGGEE